MDNSAPKLRTCKGMKYRNQTIIIDGVRFEDCEFIDCVLVLRGGYSETSNCIIHPDTVWRLEESAGLVMQVLSAYGWRISFGEGSPDDVIRFPSDLQ